MIFQIWHYLRDSAARFGDRTAVASSDLTYTYTELDAWSGRIARALMDAGIGAGDRVGMYLPKSPQGIAVMGGTNRAGAAYVPTDPTQPAKRAALIFRDCRVQCVVTTAAKLGQLLDEMGDWTPKLAILIDDGSDKRVRTLTWKELERLQPAAGWDGGSEIDPAYLLYTSGSTGVPKGVILSHRNAMAFIDWAGDTFKVRHTDRLSSHAPFHFDLSVFDIYCALRAGAAVSLVPDKITPFPIQLAQWIASEEISVWYSVPSALTRMLLHGDLAKMKYPHLRTVLFAGEVFPVKYLRQVMDILHPARFYNLYGPTETNVCTWYALPERLAESVTDIPIGRACENTDVFAVTDNGTRAKVGEVGELFARGPTVLLGYWNLAEKTASVRVPNPLQTAYSEPAYRTGDLVRLEADGNYTFLGRKDHQVKSRGYRIELGEIEQVLYQNTDVRDAAVVAVPDEEVGARLHAFVALHAGAKSDRQALTSHCLKALPRYMVPESLTIMEELPQTSTGKVDRPALLRGIATQTAK
jgi:amino acid adenylation domain-containing protein